MVRRFFRQPLDDVLACLERIAAGNTPRRDMVVMVAALVVAWFVYVPIHELLHVAGCVLSGGSVTRLEIAPQYGGTLLANVFPFVVSGSDYAGQLTGFDTAGSDLIYLATDFMPFVLSVVIGVPLIRRCAGRRRPVGFGVAVVVGLAPFYNVFGDYYEMGSILTSRAVTVLGADPSATALPASSGAEAERAAAESAAAAGALDIQGYPAAYRGIRSDDVFKLFSELATGPQRRGFHGAGAISTAFILAVLSFVLGVLLAFATYAAGHALAAGAARQPAATDEAQP